MSATLIKTIVRGSREYRITADRCSPHTVQHYSGGDTIVADDLRTGAPLYHVAVFTDGRGPLALGEPGRRFASVEAAEAAIERAEALALEVQSGVLTSSLWDFSDLTGDATPMTMEEVFPDGCDDLVDNQVEDMNATPVGGTYKVDMGAGGVYIYKRLS